MRTRTSESPSSIPTRHKAKDGSNDSNSNVGRSHHLTGTQQGVRDPLRHEDITMAVSKTGSRRRKKARAWMLQNIREEARRMRNLELTRRATMKHINQPQLLDTEV